MLTYSWENFISCEIAGSAEMLIKDEFYSIIRQRVKVIQYLMLEESNTQNRGRNSQNKIVEYTGKLSSTSRNTKPIM